MTNTSTIETFLSIEPIDFVACGLANPDLTGEVALVTGGASNIGLGYARAIAAAGASVIVTDINESAGKEAERVINLENGREDAAFFIKCDITDADEMNALADAAFAKYGKVDILVNNAMNMRLNGTILESTVEDLDASYAISGRGVMLAIKAFVPAMIERGHGTVTYSTTQFHYLPPMLGRSIYTAGKAAATSLVMSLANEVKDTGVNVFCMVPAGVGRIGSEPPPAPKEGGTPLPDLSNFSMPGFNGLVPPEISGVAMVFLLMNASALHGTGFILNDALQAMKFPFPNPDTALPPSETHKMNDMELTLAFCNIGPGPRAIG